MIAEPVPGAPLADPTPYDIEVFFDGDCPLCRREIALLRRGDRRGRIRFTDIAADDFHADDVGIDRERLMAEIHGRLPDGRWVRGVEVFRRMYAAVGWRRAVAVTRWAGLSRLLEIGYRAFARNRLRLTGRCSNVCPTRAAP